MKMAIRDSMQKSESIRPRQTAGPPLLNARDYLIQGVLVGLVTVLAFIVGQVTGGAQTAFFFMLAGLLASGLISAVVLTVWGNVRRARQYRR